MLASKTDVQTWFTDDKVQIDDANIAKPLIEAQRLIRSQLIGTFTPTTILGWSSPDVTPEIVRGIAGRLAAAFLYRQLYSAEGMGVPPYAQELYAEALAMLVSIRDGQATVYDANMEPIAGTGGIISFWPNDQTTPDFKIKESFA